MKKIAFGIVALTALNMLAAPAAAEVGGGRVEAVVGWDNVSLEIEDLGDGSRGGVLYGLGLGYDFAVTPTLALGVDVEATDATTDLEASDGTLSGKVSVGRDLYAGGRITAAVSERFNVYGKLGYTNARIKASVTDGTVTESDSANGDGVRAGIGGQFAIGSASYVGLEYRYSNYESGFSRNQVAATLGFRF